MISTDTTLQSLLKSSYNISMNTSATIEYNLNSMVDDIVITTPGITYPVINGINAYVKSFPGVALNGLIRDSIWQNRIKLLNRKNRRKNSWKS